MKKTKFSGKLSLSKKRISSLNSQAITGGAGVCPSSFCPTSNVNSCSWNCPTETTNADCTSGTSAAISCC
ncbi:class I lanthipeptide [Ulvibacterium sp.]|uniref:class I lanthipeptide n=1 Tax=Ulvibacterium sp. TaxID=2665914 RepID=UPI003BAD7A15